VSSTPLTWLLVALGAGLGATLRLTLAHTLDARWPTGTMAVNVAGSFLLGAFTALALSDSVLALLGTGFCGGLTTFSALIVQSVDRSFDDLFKGFGAVPIQIANESRNWSGSRMNFSFQAKMGIVSAPVKGFIDVTDKDVTVDADLGWLEKLFLSKQTQAALAGRVKGLLT